MQATTSLTGSGGWPMSVFLTPDLRPFYAGTYFPPVQRYNMPAFADLLTGARKILARRSGSDPGCRGARDAARFCSREPSGDAICPPRMCCVHAETLLVRYR